MDITAITTSLILGFGLAAFLGAVTVSIATAWGLVKKRLRPVNADDASHTVRSVEVVKSPRRFSHGDLVILDGKQGTLHLPPDPYLGAREPHGFVHTIILPNGNRYRTEGRLEKV